MINIKKDWDPVVSTAADPTVGPTPLTPLSVNHIIHRRSIEAQIPNADSVTPHSLRRGLATSAARAKASIQEIMRAGRWKQVSTVMEYIESAEIFSENAASTVLKHTYRK